MEREDGELTPSLGQMRVGSKTTGQCAASSRGEHLHLPRLGCGPRSSSPVGHIDAFSTASELGMVQDSIPCLVISRSALSFQTSICTIFPPRTTKRSTYRLPSNGVPSGHSP